MKREFLDQFVPHHTDYMHQTIPHTEHLSKGYSGTAFNRLSGNSHLPSDAAYPQNGPVHSPDVDGNRNMSDLVRFMARRELISTRLMLFNALNVLELWPAFLASIQP